MRRGTASLAALALALSACDGVDARSGVDALLRAAGAQFFARPAPADAGGPPVTSVETLASAVLPGQQDKRFSGRLGRGAVALALHLSGDGGHWVLPAGLPDLQFPDELTFEVRASFSPRLAPGHHQLRFQAVDDAGRAGPPNVLPLLVRGGPQDAELLVSLAWDRDADLDLHVVTPDGVEIWHRNISSYRPPPPGEPLDPAALEAAGVLDQDSNGQCLIDGRRLETVAWRRPPPAGRYLVRVDTFSLCAETDTRWTVEVLRRGEVLTRARGASTEIETRLPHGQGGGVLALEVDVP